MSKIYIAYTVVILCLFGALFAAFAMAGLGKIGQPEAPAIEEAQTDGVEPRETETAPAAAPTPSPLNQLDHPSLEAGRTYRVSHRTPIYSAPVVESAEEESLPADGYFGVQASEEHGGELWYRVTVSDGARDYTMYLLAEDLNFKRVTPLFRGPRRTTRDTERALAILRKLATGRSSGEAAESKGTEKPRASEPEPEPETFATWWRGMAQRLGGASTLNLVVAGLAAFLLTVLTVGLTLLAVWLRRTHAWERPALDEDETSGSGADRGSEFYEHDAPDEAAGGDDRF